MSPVATSSTPPIRALGGPDPRKSPTSPSSGTPQQVAPSSSTTSPATVPAQDILPRRPSPWYDLAHSLSTTALPTRRPSASSIGIGSGTPPQSTPSPPLSTSQALKEWEARLALPDPLVSRHALVPPHSPSSPQLDPTAIASGVTLIPKLVPESDKEGHIEYKLKLLNPSPDRFERLVTQLMWRLKQGKNEAIYELGLAGKSCRLIYTIGD